MTARACRAPANRARLGTELVTNLTALGKQKSMIIAQVMVSVMMTMWELVMNP